MAISYMPKTLLEALKLLQETDSNLMAGGTDLMVKHRSWSGLAPRFQKNLVFISGLKELSYVNKDYEGIHIGSGMTLEKLLQNPQVPKLLKSAIEEMASPAIRRMGTLGGNIGNASPAGDTLPVLYVLNAKLLLASYQGERWMTLEEYILGPGKTARKSEELIKEVLIDDQVFTYERFKKVGGRQTDAISKTAFCGVCQAKEGLITDFRAAINAVAPTIVRSRELEAAFVGTAYGDKGQLRKLLAGYEELIRPIDDQRSTAKYRKRCAMNLLADFLDISI